MVARLSGSCNFEWTLTAHARLARYLSANGEAVHDSAPPHAFRMPIASMPERWELVYWLDGRMAPADLTAGAACVADMIDQKVIRYYSLADEFYFAHDPSGSEANSAPSEPAVADVAHSGVSTHISASAGAAASTTGTDTSATPPSRVCGDDHAAPQQVAAGASCENSGASDACATTAAIEVAEQRINRPCAPFGSRAYPRPKSAEEKRKAELDLFLLLKKQAGSAVHDSSEGPTPSDELREAELEEQLIRDEHAPVEPGRFVVARDPTWPGCDKIRTTKAKVLGLTKNLKGAGLRLTYSDGVRFEFTVPVQNLVVVQ
jgi:hypothetical protein